MKILIHSNAPWVPTGYGVQTRNLLRMLIDLGHEVAVSAFYGLAGSPIQWTHPDLESFMPTSDGRFTRNVTVYPGGKADYGIDVLFRHAEHFGADLVITLMDTYKLWPIAVEAGRFLAAHPQLRMTSWMPIDCTPLGRPDRNVLDQFGGIRPLAMSRHGQQQLEAAGFEAAYVPHTVDLEVFRPPTDRAADRATLGLPEHGPVIGINAANRDAIRKAFPEQLEAFRMLLEEEPAAVLLMHTDPRDRGGHDLATMAEDIGVATQVRFADPYAMVAGHLEPTDMATWYGLLDLLSNTTYGEGFGVPIIESQACGVPVVATAVSAMPELLAPASLEVPGYRFWNPVHRAWWGRPYPHDIIRAWRTILRTSGQEPVVDTVEFAAGFGIDRVRDTFLAPALDWIMK